MTDPPPARRTLNHLSLRFLSKLCRIRYLFLCARRASSGFVLPLLRGPERLPRDRYVLRDLATRRIHNTVHVSRMLPFPHPVADADSRWMVNESVDATTIVKTIVC